MSNFETSHKFTAFWENDSTEETRQRLYGYVWLPLQCDDFFLPVALVLYDAAVSLSAEQSVRLLQTTCNYVIETYFSEQMQIIEVNGVMSQEVIDAFAAFEELQGSYFLARLAVFNRADYYEAQTTYTQEELQALLNRCTALIEYINDIEITALNT